jgi:outer membrane protein TolC
MNITRFSTIIRLGAALAIIAAFAAFFVREASAQTTPQRLSLGEAARLAAAQTIGVQAAGFRVEQAQARVSEARSALRPQISATPNWSSHTVNSASFGFNFPAEPGKPPLLDPNGQIIGPVKLWDFRGQAAQTVYDPAAIQRVRSARANVDAASADVATAAEQAATTAAAAYVSALRADAALQARLADSTLAADLVTIAQQQLDAGVGVALDVTRAASQLAGARAQLIAARNDRDRAHLTLLRAVNLPLDTPLELTDSLASPAAVSVIESEAAAVDTAMRSRPELRAADLQYAAAEQQIAAIRAARLPSVGVFGNDGPTGLSLGHLLNTYTYGVQLTVPVFQGGRIDAQAQEQQALVREIDARRRDLRQQVAVDVRGALLDMASAAEAVDAARDRQRLAEQEVQQAQDRFRAGVSGNADVITASLSLNSARTGLIDALTAYQSARLALARAEGTVAQIR